LAGAAVADGAVFAGVGPDVGPVHREGELTEPRQFQLLRQGEHLHETLGQHGGVVAAKRADGVVIRMGVGGEETHGDVGVGGLFDGP
jgi:hypothetical protein